MKKTIALILVLMMCFTLAAPALASTVAEQYTYTVISDSYVKITKYIGSENEIVIPSEIDGYPVQVIGKNAFYSCKAITSVTIPNTVKTIEASAFAWCEKLTSVSIPDSVTSIGDFAFMSCNGLPTITIPNSVRSMGTSVFRTCKSLTSATISNALTTIANEMFYGCSKLSGVTIPTGVFSIGERAFFNCSALKSVTMPDSVNYIKEQAFYGCRSLTELTLPNDLREIAKDAFTDCESLQNVSIPASVKTMGAHPFRGCKSLENIEVADDNPYYTDIDGVLVNKDKTMLIQYPIGKTNSSYTVPSGITHILGYAFAESTNLTSVTLSETVEDISNDDIFNSCPNLLNFEAAENNSSFCDVDGVLFNKDKTEIIRYPVGRTATSYAVPDGVTHIGDDAFTASRVLVNVTLPDTVTVIGDCSFTGCTSLESLNIPPSVTEIRLLKEIDGMQVLGDPQTFITCDKLTIYGESGSYAEAYANDCEIPFVCIEPTPAPTVAPTTQAPTAAPTTAAPTEAPSRVYTRTYIEYVGNSANTYITNNGKLPANANLGHGATNMAEVLGAFAQYVVDTNNGLTGDVAGNSATIPEMMYEDLTKGTLTKAQYIALAQAIVDYIAENGEAPAYLECDLGALSMNTLVRIFAKIVAERKATGTLTETVEVSAWFEPLPIPPEEHLTEFEDTYVIYAATSQLSYLTKNNKFSAYSTLNGEQVYQPELLGLFAQFIVNKNAGYTGATSRNDATMAEKSYENITGTSLTKAQYVQAAQDVIDYIESSLSAAAPGFVVTEAGTLSFETLLRTFATVISNYKSAQALPETVTVTAWTGESLPTPPTATEAPEYQTLNFLNILKGARRVVATIEDVGYIPTYVTLDAGTRILPGTMLRLFAATVSNINRGKATNMPLQVIDTPKNIVSETLTAGTLTKLQYIALAQRIANVIYSTDAVPTYVTSDLGTMNYCNMIYMFSGILKFYLAYGFLPDTMDVQPWGTYDFQNK